MAKVLFIVAQKGFRDEELLIPKEIIEKAGHTAKIASVARTMATGSKGLVVQPDFAVHEVNADYFDCIIIVGGPGAAALAERQDVLGLLAQANRKDKLLGAICMGPLSLAKAGVLAGREATVFPDANAIRAIKDNGGRYMNKKVVVSGNIVTADTPGSAGEFGTAIAAMLKR